MIVDFIIKALPGAGIGFLIGIFFPGVLHKLRAEAAAEAKAVTADIKAEVKKL